MSAESRELLSIAKIDKGNTRATIANMCEPIVDQYYRSGKAVAHLSSLVKFHNLHVNYLDDLHELTNPRAASGKKATPEKWAGIDLTRSKKVTSPIASVHGFMIVTPGTRFFGSKIQERSRKNMDELVVGASVEAWAEDEDSQFELTKTGIKIAHDVFGVEAYGIMPVDLPGNKPFSRLNIRRNITRVEADGTLEAKPKSVFEDLGSTVFAGYVAHSDMAPKPVSVPGEVFHFV